MVEDLVAKLLAETRTNRVPVGLRALLQAVKAELQVTARDAVDARAEAFLKRTTGRNTRYKIECFDQDWRKNWRRLRFTIAHEIAHILIDQEALQRGRSQHFYSSIQHPASERELEHLCDYGAAAILMPRAALERSLSIETLDTAELWRLYDTFLVSWRALISRISEVLFGGAALVLRQYSRRAAESRSFRVDWSYPGYKSLPSLWLPRGCTLKHFSTSVSEFATSDCDRMLFPKLTLRLGQRRTSARALALRIKSRSDSQLSMPEFDNIPVQDETSSERIILFVSQLN